MSSGEFQLIRQLTASLRLKKNVLIGPGDDCAVVHIGASGRTPFLLTTDLLIENVHFRRDWMSPEEIGFKAMRVNLSDIAAMGGAPLFALVSLGLPPSFRGRPAEKLFAGLKKAAEEAGASIVGGDTNASKELIVNVALVGRAQDRLLLRSAAKSGDDVYVTGRLGESALGLKALQQKKRAGFEDFVRSHKVPPSRLAVGNVLAALPGVHAAMDLSDGLAGDLPHILKASRVGADIDIDALPRSSALEKAVSKLKVEPLELMIAGGEDYELLFTAAPRVKIPRKIAGITVTKIGKITSKPGCLRWLRRDGTLLGGRGARFPGFRHF